MTRMSAKEKLRSYPGCRRFISLGLTQHKNQPPMDIDEHKFIFLSFHFNFNPCVTVSVGGESLLLSVSPILLRGDHGADVLGSDSSPKFCDKCFHG